MSKKNKTQINKYLKQLSWHIATVKLSKEIFQIHH
jgi:hypothetical protein